jgi:hypothetical protein
MTVADVAALVARLSLAAPVLYVGLCMALDPAGFISFLQQLARTLHGSVQRSRMFYVRQFHPWPVAPSLHRIFRSTGLVLVALAFLHIIGLVN